MYVLSVVEKSHTYAHIRTQHTHTHIHTYFQQRSEGESQSDKEKLFREYQSCLSVPAEGAWRPHPTSD